jgi:predicted O-methyltransferase YrrM
LIDILSKKQTLSNNSSRNSDQNHGLSLILRYFNFDFINSILIADGEQFDVIFIDADKENYIHYYNLAMSGLLSGNGFILADNSMCALLYDETDERSKKLHEFNQFVKNDKRVEQVILTIREGISMIKPIKNN